MFFLHYQYIVADFSWSGMFSRWWVFWKSFVQHVCPHLCRRCFKSMTICCQFISNFNGGVAHPFPWPTASSMDQWIHWDTQISSQQFYKQCEVYTDQLENWGPLKGRRKWINQTWIVYGFRFQSFNFGIVQSWQHLWEMYPQWPPETYPLYPIVLYVCVYMHIFIHTIELLVYIYIHMSKHCFHKLCRGFPQILKSQISTARRSQVPSSMEKNPLLHRTWDCKVASIAGSTLSWLDRSFTRIVYVQPGRRCSRLTKMFQTKLKLSTSRQWNLFKQQKKNGPDLTQAVFCFFFRQLCRFAICFCFGMCAESVNGGELGRIWYHCSKCNYILITTCYEPHIAIRSQPFI